MKLYRAFTFSLASILAGLLIATAIWLIQPSWLQLIPEPPASLSTSFNLTGPVSYADAVEKAAPSVVSVFAVKVTKKDPHPIFKSPLIQDLFGKEFSKPTYKRENSLGSGVIINSNGFILTNNHVVERAREIEVVLNDGRRYRARIVGTDPETDLAVLQAAGDKLQIANLGDSDKARVGDVVLAIGNPFAVGQTVTMGIISATGRHDLGITNFENFIQTDASINPGNSGGALINAHGEVIAINTAIFSKSGGSQGIGFAIPIKTAKHVMQQIADYGRVVRGWLGIAGQQLTPALAESLDLSSTTGILISGVLESGPADQTGIVPGDVITEIAGVEIRTTHQMLNEISIQTPGSTIDITLFRNGKPIQLDVTVAERPAIQ